jgi:hypothetical protein
MMRVSSLVCALMLGLAVALPAQDKPAPPVGKWAGSVAADVGEMQIQVSVVMTDGKVSGEITTFHGAFTIDAGELQKDGRWKLSFTSPEGPTGSMTGLVKGDTFSGDWDFRPNAVGSFTLTRVKER